jgi:hypothetical protein
MLSYADVSPSDEVSWKHLQIPIDYLNDNWPIRVVSCNANASKLAVCGRRGLLIYHTKTQRWRMFGDRQQERQIKAFALCWFDDFIVIGNIQQSPQQQQQPSPSSSSSSTLEVLIYNSSHLDASSLMLRQELPKRKPLFFDCNENYLIFYSRDSFFYQYHIICTYRGTGKMD